MGSISRSRSLTGRISRDGGEGAKRKSEGGQTFAFFAPFVCFGRNPVLVLRLALWTQPQYLESLSTLRRGVCFLQ